MSQSPMAFKSSAPTPESRQTPRLKLPPMYTLVRVRIAGEKRYHWTGYVYDVSQTGMRFEIDAALEPGTRVEARAMLPGAHMTTFTAVGHVVRLHDESAEPGPVRMGMAFDHFKTDDDGRRLSYYLTASLLKAA